MDHIVYIVTFEDEAIPALPFKMVRRSLSSAKHAVEEHAVERFANLAEPFRSTPADEGFVWSQPSNEDEWVYMNREGLVVWTIFESILAD